MPPNVMHVDLHPSIKHAYDSSEQLTSNLGERTAFQIDIFEQQNTLSSVTKGTTVILLCAVSINII